MKKQITPATAARQLKVIVPFEPRPDGSLMGAIVITAPGTVQTGYYVFVEGDSVRFLKDGGDGSDHTVDLDMGCCDCAGYRYLTKCRHLSAARKLKEMGKI